MIIQRKRRKVQRTDGMLIKVATYDSHRSLIKPMATTDGAIRTEQAPVVETPIDVGSLWRNACAFQSTSHPGLEHYIQDKAFPEYKKVSFK